MPGPHRVRQGEQAGLHPGSLKPEKEGRPERSATPTPAGISITKEHAADRSAGAEVSADCRIAPQLSLPVALKTEKGRRPPGPRTPPSRSSRACLVWRAGEEPEGAELSKSCSPTPARARARSTPGGAPHPSPWASQTRRRTLLPSRRASQLSQGTALASWGAPQARWFAPLASRGASHAYSRASLARGLASLAPRIASHTWRGEGLAPWGERCT
jgi:hypothetical protein